MSDLVPEEAIEAAAAALESQEVDADDPRAWFRGHAEGAVRAAAPLILAAELDRLVRDHGHEFASTGIHAVPVWALTRRASVLRGEGDQK